MTQNWFQQINIIHKNSTWWNSIYCTWNVLLDIFSNYNLNKLILCNRNTLHLTSTLPPWRIQYYFHVYICNTFPSGSSIILCERSAICNFISLVSFLRLANNSMKLFGSSSIEFLSLLLSSIWRSMASPKTRNLNHKRIQQ